MKKLLAFLALAVAVFAADSPVITIDFYGGVFVDGQNTNKTVADFARDPANFALAPLLDAAVAQAALAGRAKIAADIKAATDAAAAQVEAKEAEKQATLTAASEAHAAAIAAKEAQIATLTARVAELEAQLAAATAPTPAPTP